MRRGDGGRLDALARALLSRPPGVAARVLATLTAACGLIERYTREVGSW